MKDFLFKDFKKLSAKEWKQKIQVDLKGVDYQSLITHTIENIDIKPFYHADNFKSFKNISSTSFNIAQDLDLHNEEIGNKIIKKAIDKGAEIFIVNFFKKFDIDKLIEEIDFQKLHFRAEILDVDFLKRLYQKTKGKSQITIDPIGHFARYGNWFENQDKDFKKIAELQDFFPSNFPFIEINAGVYKNAGASITQELSYALSQAIDYATLLNNNVLKQIQFRFAIGNHYFFEIAKFKVFRVLWELITHEYQLNIPVQINAIPSIRNKTIFDPYVNMLRTSMEMMSAILGGANVICNMSFDKIYHKSNAFSERIARNQLIILREEAYFDKAINSFEGNYYLEDISNQIAEKSLEIFKIVEKSGGLLSQLYKEKIQEKIEENHQKELVDFENGDLVLVGTNKYINKDEKAEDINIYPFLKKRKGQTLIRPVVPKRIAEKTEIERLTKQGVSF